MSNPENVDQKHAAQLMVSGHFQFQTMNDAHTLASFLSEACPAPRSAIVGITEMLLNAVEHGNLGIGFDEKSQLQKENHWISEIERRLALPENKEKFVLVDFQRHETEIHIKITDQGRGFDWHQFQEINAQNLLSTHGRGIIMAKSLTFKELRYSDKGNEVTCVISLV